MYYYYVEIEYVATNFSPARTDLALKLLTLSCLGAPLVRHLAVAIHISPSNGPIEMILSANLVVSVLAMHCEPSIISIGPLLIKLLYLYVKGWLACWRDE